MTTGVVVRQANLADVARIAAVLDAAFDEDPVSRWVFPQHPDRSGWHRGMFEVFARWSLMTGGAQVTTADTDLPPAAVGSVDAAALWLLAGPEQPGKPPDFPYEPALEAALGPAYHRFVQLSDLMDAAHPRHTDHAYLPFLGVLPQWQDHGLGRALMIHRLADLDTTGTPAYLEATSLRSVTLYEHLGFVRTKATIRVPGGPALWPMWRDPTGFPRIDQHQVHGVRVPASGTG